MYHLRRFTIFIVILLSFSFIAWFLPRALNPTPPTRERQLEDKRWIDSSPYWLDRQACRWLSICGAHHLSWDPAALASWKGNNSDGELRRLELRALFDETGKHPGWESVSSRRPPSKRNAEERRRIMRDVPAYVLEYAPLVHLYSGENFWPADIAEHIRHMTPYLEGEALNRSTALDKLDLLNLEGDIVFLTSDDDVESRPEWLHSHVGIPEPWDNDGDDKDGDGLDPGQGDWDGNADGRYPVESTTWFDVSRSRHLQRISDPRRLPFQSASDSRNPLRLSKRSQHPMVRIPTAKPDSSGRSSAPAVLILVDKGSGIVDAFWFFFYSYNLGQTVLGIRFGNHVGDWEHCMMRFENGVPRGVFLSEHEGGQAYAYHALERQGVRPVVYSAVGSHAMYAQPGPHPYVLPFGMLKDVTDRGPIWDPAKNIYSYWYNYVEDLDEDLDDKPGVPRNGTKRDHKSLVPTSENPEAPTAWFHYSGPWGDEVFSLADVRQWRLFNQYHYVTGPMGPKFKRLDREKVCQNDRCHILHSLKPGQTWYG